jgi:hypothetical protein
MKKQEQAKKGKKEGRIHAKYVHVTLHKLANPSLDHWLDKGMNFRTNTVACLVGLEENHEEGKGVHAHIVIQFSTSQQLFRRNFVDHFGDDGVDIRTKPNKEALLMALGYISKTGNTKQVGEFTHRGVALETNPEVYRFQYMVKSVDDGLKYFDKLIKEYLGKDKNIIKEYAKRDDAIGRWLRRNRQHTSSLHKLANTWHLDHANEQKQGFNIAPWASDPYELSKAYRTYLKAFPDTFKHHLPAYSDLTLEYDYDRHEAHDLEVVLKVAGILALAQKDGPHRPHKAPNLYLWSRAPSFGKTRLLRFLDANLMAYRLPDDQYYIDYENNLYQALVSDEAASFLKSKDYSHLKHILEGERVEFNLKGREKIYKEDNPLIILADNVSFDELMQRYHKGRYTHDVMATRVLDLELKSRATLHFFLDRCVTTGPVAEQQTLDL